MIDFSKKEIILIDDSHFTHTTWDLRGRPQNIKVNSFLKPQEFIETSSQFSKDALIYIDSNLADNKLGEIEAKKIFDLGFENIWLVTGEPEKVTSSFPWLKGVSDKRPPWMVNEDH